MKKTETETAPTTNETPAPEATSVPTPEPEDLEPALENPNGFSALTIDDKVAHLAATAAWATRQIVKLKGKTP